MRWINPEYQVVEIASAGMLSEKFLREAIFRKTRHGLILSFTTGNESEPMPGNYTAFFRNDGSRWGKCGEFRHPRRGLFTTELFTPDGNELHAFLQLHFEGEWLTHLQNFRVVSHDGGLSWNAPHSVPGNMANVWVGKGIIHSSSRWIFPVSWAEHRGPEWSVPSPDGGRDGNSVSVEEWSLRNHRYLCGAMISDDRGVRFRLCGGVTSEKGHLVEPRITELSDGSMIMLMRSWDEKILWQSRSSDRGENWAPARPTEIPSPSTKNLLLRAPDGMIFLIHSPMKERRGKLSLWVSGDDMNSWGDKVDLVTDDARNLNYPDGFIDENGDIDFVFEDARGVYRMRIENRWKRG